MTARTRPRNINPLLGVYFGIFVASLVAMVVMLLIFEQLGLSEGRLRLLMTFGALCLFIGIGAAAYTTVPAEFLLSGRRVPSLFAGLALAVSAVGGTGLLAFSGGLFLAGFDALCVPIGLVAGLVVMVVLVAPYLRKFGAPTVPAYLGSRFQSPLVRLASAMAAAAPLILLLIAEVKVALMASGSLLGLGKGPLAAIIAMALALTLLPGGVRSLSWSGAAKSIAALLALLIPATIVAVMVTNLPLGQMSHGPLLRTLGRTEIAQGISSPQVSAFTFELPGLAMQAIAGRYATPFASVGPAAFVLVALAVMLGIAGSPTHLGRTLTTPSVYEARKSIGWSVFVVGMLIMTLSGLAVFYRDLLLNQIAGTAPATAPQGLRTLVSMGLAEVDQGAQTLTAMSVMFQRDGVLVGLPILLGFPAALVLLATTGVLAAALAAAAASLTNLALIIADDVVGPSLGTGSDSPQRLLQARIAIATLAGLGAGAASLSGRDPLDLVLWSLALSGAGLFPVLMLSIWWKRINATGAVAGLLAGFLATGLGLMLALAGLVQMPPVLSAIVGVPVSFIAAIAGSLATERPPRHLLEMVRDLRVPGGEPVQDRELRLARQQQARRG